MPYRALTFYARQLLNDPKALKAALTTPVLVWELPPEKKDDELVFGTMSGPAAPRPTSRDPLVFELKKGSSKNNAFGFGITVGRTENNDIALDDNSVSRFHGYFQEDPKKGWHLVDADSHNGTFVDGVKLASKKPTPIRPGTKLKFGSVEMTVYSPETFIEFINKKMNA